MVALWQYDLALVGKFDGNAACVCSEDLGVGGFIDPKGLVFVAPKDGFSFVQRKVLGVVE